MVPPLVKQSWMVFSVLLNSMNQGLMLSYTFSLLPGLMAKDSTIKVDLDTASWLASCFGLSMIMGIIFASFSLDILGRRNTLAISLLPGIAGGILMYYSTNVTMLMTGRLLGGLTVSSAFVTGCVIVGEHTSPEYRGLFCNLKTTFTCLGNLIMHVLGTYFEWRTVALLCVTPLVISFVINMTCPESSMWLASRNKFKESEAAFFYMRGTTEKSVHEFDALIQAQRERVSKTITKLTSKQKLLCLIKNFRKKEFVKPILISQTGFLLLEACGRHIFPAYATDILRDVIKDENRFSLMLGIDVVTVASVTIATVLVKMLKRRTVLFSTGITSTVLLLCISLYMLLISNGSLSNDKPWLLPSLMIVYFIFANFGCTAIPLVIFAELFPLSSRAIGSGVTAIANAVFITVALKFSPLMFSAFKIHGTFAILALIMSLSLLYLYFTLPETRNRTLQEIEDYYIHGRFLDDQIRCEQKDDEVKLMLRKNMTTDVTQAVRR